MDLWVIVIVAGFVEYCTADDGKSKWTYDSEDNWSTLCREGKRQSPINIDSRAAVTDIGGLVIRGPLQFRRYSAVPLLGGNNGHTVQFAVDTDSEEPPPTLSGGPLRRVYQLHQLHFHWLGEHAIDDTRYPLEIHLVHRRRDLALPDAVQESDGLVVLAVMCQLSPEQSDRWALQQISGVVPALVNVSSHASTPKVDLLRLLGPDRDAYYTYEGSLTTPDCLEVVTWLVFEHPIRITDEQYKVFSKVHVGGVSNFRSVQPLRGRMVYRAASRSAAGAARPPPLAAAAAALAALLAHAVDAALAVKKHLFGFAVAAR